MWLKRLKLKFRHVESDDVLLLLLILLGIAFLVALLGEVDVVF
ncbi:hypothetical protein [Vibrio jasicida]|nr:hypothetical protein [Vibrio jasicida]